MINDWSEFERVISPALRREQSVDARANINWPLIEQDTLGAACCVGCTMLERIGRKAQNPHTKVLFELRNAYVHNSCNIAQNRNSNALALARNYLSAKTYRQLSLDLRPYYRLAGTLVQFEPPILLAIRLCLR